jgi:hypothetical protein
MDQMSKLEKKKQILPFDKLFRVVSPKEFINLFNSELPQTKAFLLSFSPRKEYINKVIHLLDVQESNEQDITNRSSFRIREYLNRCQEDTINLSFIQAVEKEIESMITGYESFNGFPNPRKRFF